MALLVSDGLDVSHGFRRASPFQSIDLDRAISEAQRRGVAVFTFYAPSVGLTSVSRIAVNYGQGSLNDATGKFLIPGLWDMHVHLTKAGENTLPLFIVNGATSVRDMGGDYVEVLKWRKEAADGTRLAPRIKTPGALLESAENVARMKREGTVEPVEKYRIGVATPEEARKAVDLMASLGVDFVKFRTTASPET